MNSKDTVVFVAGHRGMVGSAIIRELKKSDYRSILTADRQELDLTNQLAVQEYFRDNKIDQVYLSAAKVGGIHANDTYPVDFLYDNLMIQTNVISSAHRTGVGKLLFLGSSCIYPKFASQPMREDALLTGVLEPTNEPYAIAKIAGIKLCESYNRQHGTDYRSVMPTNLYGPRDNFHAENSHVVPALIRRFHQAAIDNLGEVEVWGSGKPKREFLHVDDMASACRYVMELPEQTYNNKVEDRLSHVNVGSGEEYSIRELSEEIAKVTGFRGKLKFDASKPDGTPRKLMDNSMLNSFGWKASKRLSDGLSDTYQWYLQNHSEARI